MLTRDLHSLRKRFWYLGCMLTSWEVRRQSFQSNGMFNGDAVHSMQE